MNTRARLGPLGIVLVAVLSLLCGAIAGAVAGSRTHSTTTVVQNAQSGTSGNGNSVSPVSSSNASGPPLSWAEVVRRDGPAVVTIINTLKPTTDIFGNPQPGGTAEGSGFIVDHKGDIVTNNHVIDGAQSLQVVFSNGKKADAQVVRADSLQDLAVVKVNASVPAVLAFGDSNTLQPGDPLLAIGSALGEYRNTVTSGVLSATGRTVDEPNGVSLHNMMQTDAAINQGNSGGPLLNDRGQVVGVNTAITRGSQQTSLFGTDTGVVAEGLGFAIPSSTVQSVAARLIQNKPPAFLGVQYHEVTKQEAAYYNLPTGAYVNTVKSGSPAAQAHLQPRDIITKINGSALSDTYSLEQVVAEHNPGQKVTLTVWRNGKTLQIVVKLGARS